MKNGNEREKEILPPDASHQEKFIEKEILPPDANHQEKFISLETHVHEEKTMIHEISDEVTVTRIAIQMKVTTCVEGRDQNNNGAEDAARVHHDDPIKKT